VTENTIVSLSQKIRQVACDAPKRPALTIGARTISYDELDRQASRAAAGLRQEGVQPGEAVCFIAANTINHVICIMAATRIGAVIVPLPPSAGPSALVSMLVDSGARLLLADAELEPDAPNVKTLGLASPAFDAWLPDVAGNEPNHTPKPDERCTIIYSSGTTGKPKGIVQSHAYRSRVIQGGITRGYTASSVTLLATPLYSNTTLASFLQTFGAGGHVVMMEKFEAGEWLRLAAHHKVTHAMLVPVMIERLLRHPDFDKTDLSSFLMKFCTSAPFAVNLKREVLERWPGGLMEFYGMTEGGASFTLKAHERPDKLHTVGQIAPDSEVRVLNHDGNPAAPGEPGEIITTAPGIMLGYHNRPEATSDVILTDADGKRWICTGDIGQLDDEGFLTILDRKKDMIISGGFNIYPIDIENVAREHPQVRDVSVTGVPSQKWGETPVAFVVGSQISPGALKEWLNVRVSKMQRVHDIVVVDELPRSAIGKILKRELRDMYVSQESVSLDSKV
tara:strand:+ start:277 stop:1797 length:1521 start_codon:yes stop_codon:yes gene_type:complete